MENSNQHIIDQYLSNKMDEAARQAFEARMKTDAALASDVKLQQETLSFLDVMGDQTMKAKLDAIHNKMVSPTTTTTPTPKIESTKTSNNLPKIFGLLLSLLLLGGLAYYFLNKTDEIVEPAGIYAQHYQAYPINFGTRSTDQEVNLQQANALYKNKKYTEALPLIENLLTTNTDSKLRLAAGICALETKNPDQALSHFKVLIDKKDPLYLSQAHWYAAMTALQMNKPEQAKTYLQALVSSTDKFKNAESKAILKLLK